MDNAGDRIVAQERRVRVHGLARLGFVTEDIPAGESHRRRVRRLDVGAEERGAEERGVGAGAVVAAPGRPGDVEEREFRGRSAGNEAVGVDCPGRRGVVVGVDHAVHVAESRRGGGRRNIQVAGQVLHGGSGGAI